MKHGELDSSKGCLNAIFIGILFWIAIIGIIVLCACNPYPKLSNPTQMNYSINGILCRDYIIRGDTLILYDAGYYAKPKHQNRTTEIRLISGNHIIIKL